MAASGILHHKRVNKTAPTTTALPLEGEAFFEALRSTCMEVLARSALSEERQEGALRAAINAVKAELSDDTRTAGMVSTTLDIGRTIRQARSAAGISQITLSARLKTSQANITRLEKGRVAPNTRTLLKIADATGHRLAIAFVQDPVTQTAHDDVPAEAQATAAGPPLEVRADLSRDAHVAGSVPTALDIGRTIRQARSDAGLSQTALGARLNTSHANITRLEKGRVAPNTRTLLKIADATGHRLAIAFVQDLS